MKIPQFKRFTEEDYKDAPAWVSRFFQQLNNILEAITNALTRRLTFEDNSNSEVVKLNVQNNVTKVIRLNQLKRNPIIGLLGKTNYFEEPGFTWQISPDRALTVEVTVSWANPPDDEVECTFVFFGGEPDIRDER